MINKKDFARLHLDDRAQYVWDNGTFLEVMEYYGYTIMLYALPGRALAEVYYDIKLRTLQDVRLIQTTASPNTSPASPSPSTNSPKKKL